MAKKYDASNIQVLEGLEPVRKRPGMYIGGVDIKGYHHLLWEIVDNSVDEVINGYGSRIEVTLHKDGKSVTIDDDGRGIPVDIKKEFKKSALELVQRHVDVRTVAVDHLVDGVVDDLPQQVVIALGVGAADVHAGPAAHRLQPFQDRDVL